MVLGLLPFSEELCLLVMQWYRQSLPVFRVTLIRGIGFISRKALTAAGLAGGDFQLVQLGADTYSPFVR